MATFPVNATAGHGFKNVDYVGKCRTSELTCVAYKLSKNQKYRFRIRAGIRGTFGPYSRFLDFTFPAEPPAPTSPQASKTFADSMTVVWTAPLYPDTPHGGIVFEGNTSTMPRDTHPLTSAYLVPVLGYEIETGKGPAGELSFYSQDPSNQTEQQITDLDAGTMYRFRVRAWNSIGYSPWSVTAAAFTNTFVPQKPDYLNFSDVTMTSCAMEWHRPAEGGGKIQHYEILMAIENDKPVKPNKLVYTGQGVYNATTLKDLHPGWKYGFRVRAINGNGPGAFSNIFKVRMLDPVPNRPPPPRVTRRTNESMHVEFEKAIESSGAFITEYELSQALERLDVESGVYNFASAYRGHRKSVDLKQLAVGACYRFRVRTFSDTGTVSDWSHDGKGCTVSMVPSTPLAPHVVNETTSSLTLRWSRPHGRGNDNMTYHVEMMGKAAPPADAEFSNKAVPLSVAGAFTRVYTGKDLAFEAMPLLADSVYTFRVVAENLVGASEISPETAGRTRALLPDPPAPPTLALKSSSMIKVRWEVPAMSEEQTEPVTRMELQAAEGTEESGAMALWVDVYNMDDTEYTLSGARPNTGYRFRLRGENSMGWSDWGQPLSVVTSIAAPEQITGLRLVDKNPMHVKLAWDPPRTNGAPPLSYMVQLAGQDPETKLVRKAGSSELPKLAEYKTVQNDLRTNVTLQNKLHVALGQMHAVRVQAISSAGDSKWSDPLVFWTKPGPDGLPYPSDQVDRPHLSEVTDTGATVAWNRPDDNGGPTAQFLVEASLLDDTTCYLNTKLGDTKSAFDCSVVSLAPDTRVLSPYVQVCVTEPAAAYSVGAGESRRRVQPEAPLTCKIDRLLAGGRYAVRVRALNFIGYSYASAPALLALYPEGHAAPATLLRPFVGYADSKNVVLRWTPDAMGGQGASDKVEGYDVGAQEVPAAMAARLAALESTIRASKRALQFAQQMPADDGGEVRAGNMTADEAVLGYSESMAAIRELLAEVPVVIVAHLGVAELEELSFRAAGLQPGQSYAFSVRAYDADGAGDWSDPVSVRLSADVPTAPPPVYLREAGTDYLLLEVRSGHMQGSALTGTIIQMQVVEDSATGKWSPFHVLARLPPADPTTEGGVQLLRLADVPANTNFGFRAASVNQVGLGELGEPMRYWTKPAPLTRPNPPLAAKIGSRVLGVMIDRPVPANMLRKMRSNEPVRGTLPKPTKRADGAWGMSALDYLYASHQDFDTADSGKAGLSATKYELEMNVGTFREMKTVCLQESAKCTVEGLAPSTKYIMRARVREAWGVSAWSFPIATTTSATVPDAPSQVSIAWIGRQQVKLSWTPPKPNGGPLIGFQVFGARVPRAVRRYTKNVVTTFTPPEPYRAGPTDGLPKYIMSSTLRGDEYPSAHTDMMLQAEDEEDDDIWFDEDKGEDYLAGKVVLEPNVLSPEAVATVKPLPEPDLPGYLAEDMEARKKFKVQQLADDEVGADFTEMFLTDLSNVTGLSYTWSLPLRRGAGLYVVQVRALNKYGYGPLSPISRFYGSNGTSAMPPDEPAAPELSRTTGTSMQLTWRTPRDNGAVVNQFVLRALVGKDLDPKRVELDPKLFQDIYVGSDTSHTLTRVVPGQFFYFYLFARNSVGQSPPSAIRLFQVPGDKDDGGVMVRFNESNITQQLGPVM